MAEASMYLKPKQQSFANFLYNPEKGEVCGRTKESWAKIGVFYLVFYLCLAGFFAAMMAVFYQTLDTENEPKFSFGHSILRNPALGYRPRSERKNIESTLIWYKTTEDPKQSHWVDQLNKFIADYEGVTGGGQDIRDCTFAQFAEEKYAEKEFGTPRPRKACKFLDTWLQTQEGNAFNSKTYCHKAENWGYNRESPCIILKLNKIIGWEPDPYTSTAELPAHMPRPLRDHITQYETNNQTIPPMAWVSCEGENPADKEYLPDIKMLPFPGFPAYYFPYWKNDAYRSPLVAVQFSNPAPNILINIECRIWAKNIVHDRQHRLGMVHFELLKD